MQMPKRKRCYKDAAPYDDIIALIHLVRQNPALYNYKLQPYQRRRSEILHGWAQVAMQIGNKYTVEECRRKWKNLRDTYHQYRLRKSKVGYGLSKWRYAKELDFLSTIYQPKLKSHRIKYEQTYGVDENLTQVQAAKNDGVNDQQHDEHHYVDDDNVVHPGNITLVDDDAEAFLLQAYEDSANDNVVDINPDDAAVGGMSHIELSHEGHVNDLIQIVKNEQQATSSLDVDGAAGAEIDYEEVCLYDEDGNTSNVDREAIIRGADGRSYIAVGNNSPSDSKAFQYINTTEFCIEPMAITPVAFMNTAGTLGCNGNSKSNLFKTISLLPSSRSTPTTTFPTATTTGTNTSNGLGVAAFLSNAKNTSGTFVHLQPQTLISSTNKRDELDLFFEFLKNKMQRFAQVDITSIQIELLNCVLRREAESAQKSSVMQ